MGAGSPNVTASYWDIDTSATTDDPRRRRGNQHRRAAGAYRYDEHQSPSMIYAEWDVDVDGDNDLDNPWDFGKNWQYPVLKYGGLNADDQRGQGNAGVVRDLDTGGRHRPRITATLDRAAKQDTVVTITVSAGA